MAMLTVRTNALQNLHRLVPVLVALPHVVLFRLLAPPLLVCNLIFYWVNVEGLAGPVRGVGGPAPSMMAPQPGQRMPFPGAPGMPPMGMPGLLLAIWYSPVRLRCVVIPITGRDAWNATAHGDAARNAARHAAARR